ncbi:MAG TPA: hypothetical protein VIX82_10175 [Solirubrobacteraceae bacterium]
MAPHEPVYDRAIADLSTPARAFATPRRVALASIAIALVTGVLATAGAASVPSQVGFVCTPANALLGGGRDPACWPFATSSPWNAPIGSAAALASSTACTREIQDHSLYTDIASSQWSHPLYIARASDPVTALYTTSGGGPSAYVASVHAPSGMSPADPQYPSGDAHLHIVDPTHSVAYEQWQARRYGSGWLSTYETTTSLSGPGVGQGGVRAYGGSALGGLIRNWEIQAGAIRHPLAVAIQVDHQTDSWVWPATANDGWSRSQYTGHIPMGQLFAIPRSYGLTANGTFSLALFKQQLGLQTQVGTTIALAARNYGAYLVDSGGAFSFYAEPWGTSLVAPALNVYDPNGHTDADKIRSAMQCVTSNSPATPGGGGAPLAPPAPPLGSAPRFGPKQPGPPPPPTPHRPRPKHHHHHHHHHHRHHRHHSHRQHHRA